MKQRYLFANRLNEFLYFRLYLKPLENQTQKHHLKQMEKALKNADTSAYNSVMDRIKGKPIQSITIDESTIRTRRYVDATGND